jgi:MinD superfamily P-loop ATPase
MLRRLRDQPPPRRDLLLNIDHNLCHSCGACVAVCPPDCLFLAGLTLTVDQSTCTACNRCVAICPVKALALTAAESVRAAS